MKSSFVFQPLDLTLRNSKTWLLAGAFVAGNLVFPQLCHLIPNGGLIFLPIYFFTLIAAYKFGLKAGLLTAIFSPILNSLLFGMPFFALLPVILIKSCLLAIAAALIAKKSRSVSIWLIALVILIYQVFGGMAEWAITANFQAAVQDFMIGFPGMLIQLFGGFIILSLMARYER